MNSQPTGNKEIDTQGWEDDTPNYVGTKHLRELFPAITQEVAHMTNNLVAIGEGWKSKQ